MSSKKKENIKSIAVIGEREIVMGYRLLGVEDTFTVTDKNEAVKKMESLFSSHKYNLNNSKSIRTRFTFSIDDDQKLNHP